VKKSAAHRSPVYLKPGSTTRTAAVAYKERYDASVALLGKVGTALKKHRSEFAKDDKNWGYVGDLGDVEKWLRYALSMFVGEEDAGVEGMAGTALAGAGKRPRKRA